MTNIHSHPTPLRQKFIEYLTLNRKAERTVHCYVSFIYSLAKHCRRSPDLLGPEDIRHWLYYLIAERKQAASTVNLAINAVRSFYGGLTRAASSTSGRTQKQFLISLIFSRAPVCQLSARSGAESPEGRC
jgi:site-specific recombinase XerD